MEKTDFYYKRKPAFLSFTLVYIFCFVIAILLIINSSTVSQAVNEQLIARLRIPQKVPVRELPYGLIFSLPFLIYGIYRALWNIMSIYEFKTSEIRLITGSLIRKEKFFAVHEFFRISFRQNLFEAPFGIGSITLISIKTGKRLIIRGVYGVKSVVETIRAGLGASY